MKQIDLRIDGRRYKRKLPAHWGEMTRRQVLAVARMYQSMQLPFGASQDEQGQEVSPLTIEQRFMLLRVLLSIPEKEYYKLGELAVTSLLSDSPFRLEENHPISGDPVLRYLRIGWCRYRLPEINMEDATMVQFTWAEKYYRAIQSEADLFDNLNGLVSVLCASPRRRLALFLTSWMPFLGNYLIRWDKKYAHKIKLDQAMAVLMYYYGCRQQLIDLYRPIFSPSGGGSRRTGPDLTSKYEWWALVHDLAEKGIFGNFYATCYSNVHDILHHVSYNSDKYREQEIKRTIHG